jgi:hypothetical protein
MSFSNWIKTFGVSVMVCGPLTLMPLQQAQAQDSAQSATAQTAAASQPQLLTDEELETLVARIALYPDDLVALVLAGSLYPLQIVQADRYLDDVKKKPDLKPNANWDGSVISLLNYPQVIDMMNGDLDWTQKLGEAIVNQQKDVLEAIQDLRDRAVANKIIKSDDKVIVEEKNENIVITPAKEEATYVPQYDPAVLSPTYVYEEPPIYYGDPYPSYYYPYAPYWPWFYTGAMWGAAIDWDDWHSWGGDVDVDVDIDIDRDDFHRVEHWDRNNLGNINWDRNKFKFDRNSINNGLRRNNFDRLDRKGNRGNRVSNLPAGGNRITGNDIRRDVQRALKRQGQARQRPSQGGQARQRPSQGGQARQRPSQGGAGISQRPAQTAKGKGAAKRAAAKRPATRKAASKVDRRPRQTSGLGDYGRGRDAKQFSKRGQASRISRGGRGYGGGGQIRRRPSGGFGGGGGRGRGGGGRGGGGRGRR